MVLCVRVLEQDANMLNGNSVLIVLRRKDDTMSIEDPVEEAKRAAERAASLDGMM